MPEVTEATGDEEETDEEIEEMQRDEDAYTKWWLDEGSFGWQG